MFKIVYCSVMGQEDMGCRFSYLTTRKTMRSTCRAPERMLTSLNSQLAVCKGLVIDKVYRLKYDESILSTRCCRASYGILFNEPYNKQKHSSRGLVPQKNPIDEKKYASHQVYWLIRQGEAISRDKPTCKRFYRMIPIDPSPARTQNSEHSNAQASTEWKDVIVISRTRQLSRLPSNLHEGDAEPIGEIISFLNPQHLLSNRVPASDIIERKTTR